MVLLFSVLQYGIDGKPSTLPDLVHQGISEKVPVVILFLAAFFAGFAIAFAKNWRLALALSSILPWTFIMGTLMNKATSKYIQYARFPEVCRNCEFT